MICKRCGRDRDHAARGLCASCYEVSGRDGTLTDYELLRDGPERYVCTCSVPVLEVQTSTGQTFCTTCGYPWFSEQHKEELRGHQPPTRNERSVFFDAGMPVFGRFA